MSNEELKKYLDLHSEFTTRFVNYYNRHIQFVPNVSLDGKDDLRKYLRQMEHIIKDMKKSLYLVYLEMRENRKEEFAAKKAKRKFKVPQTPPPGKKRKRLPENNNENKND